MPAEAKIVGKDTVEVSAAGVDQPVAVRFAWNQMAQPNLFNARRPASRAVQHARPSATTLINSNCLHNSAGGNRLAASGHQPASTVSAPVPRPSRAASGAGGDWARPGPVAAPLATGGDPLDSTGPISRHLEIPRRRTGGTRGRAGRIRGLDLRGPPGPAALGTGYWILSRATPAAGYLGGSQRWPRPVVGTAPAN